MSEWEFLAELSRKADCGILLDINNVYVSSINHGFASLDFLSGLPMERVAQFHLAGHSVMKTAEGKIYLIDTHDEPICDEVWALYGKALERFSDVSVLIERDANIPEFSVLESELRKAKEIGEQTFAGLFERVASTGRNSKADAISHHAL